MAEVSGMEDAFERLMAEKAAIESAWRWFRRSKKPRIALSEVVERVHAKCPGVDTEKIKGEIVRRVSRTRSRT